MKQIKAKFKIGDEVCVDMIYRRGLIVDRELRYLKEGKPKSLTNFLNRHHLNINKNGSNKVEMSEYLQKQFFNEIREAKGIYHSMSIGRLFALKAKQFISNQTENINIKNILSVAGWNKFYYEIYKQDKGFYKPNNKNNFRKKYNVLKKMLKNNKVAEFS